MKLALGFFSLYKFAQEIKITYFRNMKIPANLIPTKSSGGYYYANYTNIDTKTVILMIICHLHEQKKISDDKLKGMFASLRKGTLDRKVNTFHNTINDRWYNDETMYEILCDTYNELCVRKDMELNVFLEYLNKYLNANKNFCINFVYTNIIEPLINSVYQITDEQINCFKSFQLPSDLDTIMSYEEAERKHYLDSGYCCRDCDGCLSVYKHNRYAELVGRDLKEGYRKIFKSYLLSQKTPSAYKNPNEILV
jgi:hypothetical protein